MKFEGFKHQEHESAAIQLGQAIKTISGMTMQILAKYGRSSLAYKKAVVAQRRAFGLQDEMNDQYMFERAEILKQVPEVMHNGFPVDLYLNWDDHNVVGAGGNDAMADTHKVVPIDSGKFGESQSV